MSHLRLKECISTNQVEVEEKDGTSETLYPVCRPHPDFNKDYNFKDKVDQFPFKFNMGNALPSKKQQDWHPNLIFPPEGISLHFQELGFCDKLARKISTTADKSVYLPYRSIPWQLQGEV